MAVGWYVLRSKPNKEEFLWGQVLAHHVESFYPVIRNRQSVSRGRLHKPYFPGYLFVHVDYATTLRSFWKWLPGSHGLVELGESPAVVPDALIAALRNKVAAANTDISEPLMGLKRGDLVTIQSGPLAEYEAVFDGCISGNDRVRVLLTHMRERMLPVELPVGQIARKKQPV
jgi:transcriptional antiterminator RfaH